MNKLIISMICVLQLQNVMAEEDKQYQMLQQKNVNNCYLISDADRQKMCLAYFENNKSYCFLVKDEIKKQQCLSNF